MKLPLRDFADVVTALKEPLKAGEHETRQAARMSVSAKIDIHLLENGKSGRCYSALTRDISLTGIGLLQSVALPPDQELILCLPRPSRVPLFVQAVSKQCRALADGLLAVGVEYTRLADEALAAHLIKNAQEQHAKIQRSVLG